VPSYNLVATTIRAVTDRVLLVVEADNYTQALTKAEEVLNTFPDAHQVDNVPYVYIEHRDNGENHIMDIRGVDADEDDEWLN